MTPLLPLGAQWSVCSICFYLCDICLQPALMCAPATDHDLDCCCGSSSLTPKNSVICHYISDMMSSTALLLNSSCTSIFHEFQRYFRMGDKEVGQFKFLVPVMAEL